MIEISTEDYRHVAALLREWIGDAEWFNGSVAIPPPDTAHSAPVAGGCGETPALGNAEGVALDEWRLTLTAIVYRRDEELPEGPRRPIDDVVPVWWEFSTGEGLNDFSFAELRPHLIDYD